tara:strand:+ start:108 stop:332 length:225 start_codon:yes stop_codon:yes gene_type:complete
MKKKNIYIEFEIGEMVFCKSDPQQHELQITGILLKEEYRVIYKAKFNSVSGYFYGFELTSEMNYEKWIRSEQKH